MERGGARTIGLDKIVNFQHLALFQGVATSIDIVTAQNTLICKIQSNKLQLWLYQALKMSHFLGYELADGGEIVSITKFGTSKTSGYRIDMTDAKLVITLRRQDYNNHRHGVEALSDTLKASEWIGRKICSVKSAEKKMPYVLYHDSEMPASPRRFQEVLTLDIGDGHELKFEFWAIHCGYQHQMIELDWKGKKGGSRTAWKL